ncbi:MAG: DNA polymerase III subunit alpha [Burkholderiales bacterium]|nr:DNA polymerase III subunit alpha [Burkholderiales bacterium]
MPAPRFVHLRLHSEYSVTDGIARIDDVVARARDDGMGALAVTDLANLFGMVKFYKACRARGIKPVIGVDAWIANASDPAKPSRALLLAASRAGYLRLCELLSRAWLANQHLGRAIIDKQWFRDAEGGSGGLIALSGLLAGPGAGEIAQALAGGNAEAAEALANEWAALFPNRFYLEIQRAGPAGLRAHAEAVLRQTVALGERLRLPVVATHPVQYGQPGEFRAHEARTCIAEGQMLGDQRRGRHFGEDQYFTTQDEMVARFADIPAALANAVEIARRCNLELVLGKPKLPLYPTPAGETIDEHLAALSRERLAGRLGALYPDAAAREAARARYEKRLEFEIATIVKMGFSGYFLIVADFINWAKNNGVPVGPGRGSGAGSLVAYALGITDLDPLAYNLLFERFLNPERVSMPDFDIDFCEAGRDRVIDYVKQKYGSESVSQIATFGTMAAKAAVRDVGRVLDLGYGFCDGIAKLIPFQPGKTITIAMAREMEPVLAEREEREEEVRELLSLAEQVEGITRSVGKHAGGVLIAPGRLTDFCPLYTQGGAEGVVSQYDKDDVEAVGLVKFDFLGLTTLTILDEAERHIRTLRPELGEFRCAALPLDDPRAYEVFKKANTVAIFQFESRGMRDMLIGARPDRFEDIIALVSLYRPGPMELIPSFIERKHGREKVTYPDPRVEPILSETYGIMVYQEQVMQMAQIIGGYSLGGADLLRRAMGKKKPEEMAQHRQLFRDGAARNGLAADTADEIFNLMEKFAGYGFNKSHAAAYALLAYHTAYLKAHHPAAFFAANMSASMDDTDKVQILAADAKANGVAILPPDINLSEYRFRPVDERTVRYGLGGIKGSGESAIASIIAARREAPFTSLFDFARRVDKRLVNRRTMESLVRAGAFDAIEADRAALLASVGIAMEAAEQAEQSASQVSLFGGSDEPAAREPELLRTLRWTKRDRLLNEKMALGYYLSAHLFDAYAPEVRQVAKTPLAAVQPREEAQLLAGIVAQLRVAMTRRGKLTILELDDGTAKIEVTVFQELVDAHRDLLKPDELVVVAGRVREDRFAGGVRISAERIMGLADLRRAHARGLRLSMNGQADTRKLMALLGPYRNGVCPVTIDYDNGNGRCTLVMPDAWRVTPREELLTSLRDWLSPEGAEIVY